MESKIRHPECHCDMEDDELVISTLKLARITTMCVEVNSGVLDLCQRQQVMALLVAASSILHKVGYQTEQIQEEITQALDNVMAERELSLVVQQSEDSTIQ